MTGADSAALQSMGSVLYQFQDLLGPVSTVVFIIGATCLYISFYRTRLIPRWLTVWGLIGKVSMSNRGEIGRWKWPDGVTSKTGTTGHIRNGKKN